MVCVEELLDKYRIFIYYRLYSCCLKYGFSLKMCPCFVLSDPIRINVLSDLLSYFKTLTVNLVLNLVQIWFENFNFNTLPSKLDFSNHSVDLTFILNTLPMQTNFLSTNFG